MNAMNNIVVPVRAKRVVKKDGPKRERRGRPSMLESKKTIAAVLRGEIEITRFLALKLVEQGYMTVITRKIEGKRGRPFHDYQLTSKGKGLVALSKNWFNKKDTEVSDEALVNAAEFIEACDGNMTEEEVIENFADNEEAAMEVREALEADEHLETVEAHESPVPDADNDDIEAQESELVAA